MSLVADYGSDSDTEEKTDETKEVWKQPLAPAVKKSALFGQLPPPKNVKEEDSAITGKISKPSTESNESGNKRKISFTVPINTESLKKKKENLLEEDAGEQPKKKGTGFTALSFLPAPINDSLLQEKVKEPEESKTEKSKESTKKPVTGKANPRRIPLSFKQMPMTTLLQEDTSQSIVSEETPLTEVPLESSFSHPTYQQTSQPHQYAYSEQEYPVQVAAYPLQQTNEPYQEYATGPYPVYSQYQPPVYNSHPQQNKNLPRDFRDFANANVVNLNQDEMKKTFPKYREPDNYETKRGDGIMPDRTQRKQGHISYLLWDMQQKETVLATKKAEAAKNRRESRAKYGW